MKSASARSTPTSVVSSFSSRSSSWRVYPGHDCQRREIIEAEGELALPERAAALAVGEIAALCGERPVRAADEQTALLQPAAETAQRPPPEVVVEIEQHVETAHDAGRTGVRIIEIRRDEAEVGTLVRAHGLGVERHAIRLDPAHAVPKPGMLGQQRLEDALEAQPCAVPVVQQRVPRIGRRLEGLKVGRAAFGVEHGVVPNPVVGEIRRQCPVDARDLPVRQGIGRIDRRQRRKTTRQVDERLAEAIGGGDMLDERINLAMPARHGDGRHSPVPSAGQQPGQERAQNIAVQR